MLFTVFMYLCIYLFILLVLILKYVHVISFWIHSQMNKWLMNSLNALPPRQWKSAFMKPCDIITENITRILNNAEKTNGCLLALWPRAEHESCLSMTYDVCLRLPKPLNSLNPFFILPGIGLNSHCWWQDIGQFVSEVYSSLKNPLSDRYFFIFNQTWCNQVIFFSTWNIYSV